MKKTVANILLLTSLGAVAALGWKAYDISAERKAAYNLRQTIPAEVVAATAGIESAARTTLVVFFTTTCEYCRAEIGSLKQHAGRFDTRQIVLVSPEDEAIVRAFEREAGLSDFPQFHVMSDPDPSLGLQLRIQRVPTTLVYGQDGTLLRQFEGLTSATDILDVVEAAP